MYKRQRIDPHAHDSIQRAVLERVTRRKADQVRLVRKIAVKCKIALPDVIVTPPETPPDTAPTVPPSKRTEYVVQQGDTMFSIARRFGVSPVSYTHLPVIGIDTPGQANSKTHEGSLKDFGVAYRETSCLVDFETGAIDEDSLSKQLEEHITSKTRLVLIQRSRGYSHRKTISMVCLGEFMAILNRKWPDILTFVDNCYCEFTDVWEPPTLGVTVTAGSLIKNPGGGLAATGGYVVCLLYTSRCV